MTNVVLTDPPFCSATTIQCDEFVLEAAGISLWVRTGNSFRPATINDPNPSGIATFDGACDLCTTTTSTTSTTSTTTTLAPTSNFVTNLFASASDILGEIYIDASVALDSTVSVDTSFDVIVSTVPYGDITVVVVITNGNNSGSGATYVGMGSLPSSIPSRCIQFCDDPSVVYTGFEC
jgi:hypothetical protein